MRVKLLKKIRKEIFIYHQRLEQNYVVIDYTTPVEFSGYDKWYFKNENDAVTKLHQVRLEMARHIMYEESNCFTYVRNRKPRLKY